MSYVRDVAERIRTRVEPSLVPEGADSLFLIYAVLVLAKGVRVGRADVHDAWAAWMTIRGEASHDAVRPLQELPEGVRAEDDPFVQAIRSVARDTQGQWRRDLGEED